MPDDPTAPSLTEAVARARCARSLHLDLDNSRIDQTWQYFAEDVERDLRDFEAAGYVVVPREPTTAQEKDDG
jgi:hypothetical protein